jgi:hypothetical protein
LTMVRAETRPRFGWIRSYAAVASAIDGPITGQPAGAVLNDGDDDDDGHGWA